MVWGAASVRTMVWGAASVRTMVWGAARRRTTGGGLRGREDVRGGWDGANDGVGVEYESVMVAPVGCAGVNYSDVHIDDLQSARALSPAVASAH